MTAPKVEAPVGQTAPVPNSVWGAGPPVFKNISPEEQAKRDADAAFRIEAEKLENAARHDQKVADHVVRWALKIWEADGWKWRNGGDTYQKTPVSKHIWELVKAKWTAQQIPGYKCTTRGPAVKAKEGNLNIGKLTGNMEIHSVKGDRAMDLHVQVIP